MSKTASPRCALLHNIMNIPRPHIHVTEREREGIYRARHTFPEITSFSGVRRRPRFDRMTFRAINIHCTRFADKRIVSKCVSRGSLICCSFCSRLFFPPTPSACRSSFDFCSASFLWNRYCILSWPD